MQGKLGAKYPLIIDDVITTGATCEHLAMVLLEEGQRDARPGEVEGMGEVAEASRPVTGSRAQQSAGVSGRPLRRAGESAHRDEKRDARELGVTARHEPGCSRSAQASEGEECVTARSSSKTAVCR